ncbi:MAG: site-specific integrase [Firmicutes bacterium]|nr:site-specific integrase [Bacillota bacterium]
MDSALREGIDRLKAQKDTKTGKWLIQYRYTDWQGNRKKSTKRGFNTKREAEEWLHNFLSTKKADFNMKFEDFLKLYYADMENRLREHTMRTKKYIIDLKIIPYFGKKKMNAINAADIRAWQNELLRQGYSQTYLKTINNQLSAIFNYAVKYYDLQSNPCAKAGSIGKSKADEMKFWTKDEFMKFIDCLMNKRQSYMAFMILYWTGMRLGELLALTPADIDLEKCTISITKSYQRIDRKDVITEPKTHKSKRIISIPEFLAVDINDYMNSLYELQDTERLIPVTKYFLEHEMQRGIKESGVKRIRIHDLRHSHASMLVDMGFSPLEIAQRLGHEKIETTLNTYSHLYPDKQSKLAARLDSEYKEGL